MHVMMPYSNRLYMLADWYRQLWAESLGKQVDRHDNEVFTGSALSGLQFAVAQEVGTQTWFNWDRSTVAIWSRRSRGA